ncbi:signal transduction histidine kinase [Natronospira proteinivora]|uniref:histidine kinase n=1 Tax=Natronospira proteinivora TaxID=1807133 RepID=A0ABT1GF15_9GAMM|nr:PDZ domain-containing protein [Natronospira proteinivora]MCP1728542.1 signal transduction histidine kinase [Natronospira proteinivora]
MTAAAPSPARRRSVSMAPLPMLACILVAGLVVIALSLVLALRGPWLGVTVAPSEEAGVVVTRVMEGSPAEETLEVGDRIIAVGHAPFLLSLNDYDPTLEPHTRYSFAAYNDYLVFQGLIHEALSQERVTLKTDSTQVEIQPRDLRPLGSLPLDFWLFHLFGLMALMISAAAWVFRQGEKAPAFLALSGVGFFMATGAHAVWVGRELALSTPLFDTLLRINHVGLALLLAGLICLLSNYPRRVPRVGLLHGTLAGLVLYQLNENLQLLDLPWHTFYLPLMAFYAVAVLLALQQWRMSRHDPVDRAALKWIFLSVFLSMGVAMVIYFVPTLMGQEPFFPQIFISGFAVTLYVGFALGVVRYRLFDLDQWWFLAWLWFLGGLLVVLIDLALVVFLGLGHVEAVGLAVLLVAWGYLPLRGWIWSMLTGRPRRAIEEKLPGLAESIVQARGLEGADQRWIETLESLFNPLSVQTLEGPAEAVGIRQYGAELMVPSIGDGAAYCLHHAENGSRLFSSRDGRTVESLLTVARRLFRIREAEEAGAKNERARIIRDLHDDVGGRVLALIHSATTDRQAELARKALDALRDTIVALDDKGSTSLDDVLFDWHEEAAQRADAADVTLRWENHSGDLAEAALSPRYRINLRRVLDEALTNALRHAQPEWVRVRLEAVEGGLEGSVVNNGLPESLIESGELRPGRGLYHMRTRMEELGGQLQTSIRREAGQDWMLEVRFSLPLAV